MGRGDVSAAFLAGVAAADEGLVAELGGDVLESCTGASDATGAMRCTRASGPQAQAWGERALAVIRREFAVVRSVRQLARRLHCHPVYLARTFRQAREIPVSDYLAAFKVGVAFRLLTHTELKICAIPNVAGFGGKATLYRNVHRLTGHTPGYWRLVRQRAAVLDHRRASLRIVDYPSSVTASPRLASVRSDCDVRFEGGLGVCEPETGPWTVPRAVATLMRPLSMRDPPC